MTSLIGKPEASDLACLTGSAQDIRAYERSITHETRDSEITALIAKVEQRNGLAALIAMIEPGQRSAILNIYAQRTASLAVQHNDQSLLRLGLLALAVASVKTEDFRDNLATQALLWRSTELLALNPREEFERAAARVPAAADFFREWIDRPPDYQALSAMGYRESGTGDTFWFEKPSRRISAAAAWREMEQSASKPSLFSRLRERRRRDPKADD